MQKAMSKSNKDNEANYIVLPAYVVNIGLLYAFLLTSGLIIAWVTIYRHEGSIKELKQMLNERQTEKQKHLATELGVRGDLGKPDADLRGDEKEKLPGLVHDSDKRSKRHSGSQQGLKGEKGEKGERGERGENGTKGQPGPPGVDGFNGQKGSKGERGNRGRRGRRGNSGTPGGKGPKGVKGDQGHDGKTVMYSESAHVVGVNGRFMLSPNNSPLAVWKPEHISGSMHFNGGYLTVGVDGYYFIYSQMYYFDGTRTITGYSMYINDREVLKAISSVISSTKKYNTHYTSGIFKMMKGQRIHVGTFGLTAYYFNKSSSFFGAFLLHH